MESKKNMTERTCAANRNNSFSEVKLTLIDRRLVFSVTLDVLGEPLIELFVGIKQRGHDEMQQSPQLRDSNNIRSSTVNTKLRTHITNTQITHLSHCVLNGSPSEQESVSTLELQ